MGELALGIGARALGALELAADLQLEPARIFGINHIIKIDVDDCHVAVAIGVVMAAEAAAAAAAAAAVAGRRRRRRMMVMAAVDHHHRSSSATDDGIHFFP